MQTPTAHPPAAATKIGNKDISAPSEGNGNPKALIVQ